MTKPISKIIGFTFITQITVFILVLFNNVLASRWLGPEGYGMMATLLILAETAYKLVNLGQETSLLYYISNKRFPLKELISTVTINGLFIYLSGVLLLLVLIRSGGLGLFFDPDEIVFVNEGAWWCMFLLFALMLHDYGTRVWLGQQKFKSYNANLLTRPILYLAMLLGLYLSDRVTVIAVVVIYAVSWLLPGMYVWVKSLFPITLKWNSDINRAILAYGLPIMFSNLLAFLIYRVDIFLIGYFLSQQEVGQYYVSVMIAERLLYLTHASSLVFLPAAAHAEEQQKKTPILVRVNVWIVLFGAILLGVLAPWIIPLIFSQQYTASVMPLIILLPGIVALIIPKIISADLLSRGLPRLTMYGTAINFVLNIVLNIWLIPRIGINGAALSSTISYFVGAMVVLYFHHRVSGVPIGQMLILKRSDVKEIMKI